MDDFYTRSYETPNERLTAAIIKAFAVLAIVATPFTLIFS